MTDGEEVERRRGQRSREREAGRRSQAAHLEFGRTLGRLRRLRRLSQRQLAERADIDASYLSRLESGGRGVSREVIDRLATALNATPAEQSELLKAGGILPEEAVALLDEPDLGRLSALLADPSLRPADRHLFLSYVRLALQHAAALGYDVRDPVPGLGRSSPGGPRPSSDH